MHGYGHSGNTQQQDHIVLHSFPGFASRTRDYMHHGSAKHTAAAAMPTIVDTGVCVAHRMYNDSLPT